MPPSRPHAAGEERMRLEGLGLELGMVLAADEVGMPGELDHLHQPELLVDAGRHHAALLQPGAIGVVDLVAMAVPLADLLPAIEGGCERTGLERAGIGA